jgi:hypothetical protein
MSTDYPYPIVPEDARFLVENNLLTELDVETVPDKPNMRQISREAWEKLELENRPCIWCGRIMEDEVDPNTKDTCLDCTSPQGM